jgi:hypothetical protein
MNTCGVSKPLPAAGSVGEQMGSRAALWAAQAKTVEQAAPAKCCSY